MSRLLVILFLLLPLMGFSQYVITGRIVNENDKKPVADASVFLNNATVGSKSGDNGAFILSNVRPGQYDLVVSIVGFETVHQNIMVNGDMRLAEILISPKTIALKEVKIRPPGDRDRDLQTFKRLFLGTSDFAADCTILNPDLLDLDFDAPTLVFTATSSDYLEIENKALGYKIKYLLTGFKNDGKSGILYFEGTASFEEMTGKPAAIRRWQKNRLKVYQGSSMHFLRSAIADSLETEGFRELRLVRKLNPDSKDGVRDKYKETLVGKPWLSIVDFFKRTNVTGEYALNFDDCLYVLYAKKWAHKGPRPPQADGPLFLDDPTATTVIFEQPYILFDTNGIIINPQGVLFEGIWGQSRIAELLPVDYVPSGRD